jgi:ubiquinone/menaquinone biosynthesis C-methylase UbiE
MSQHPDVRRGADESSAGGGDLFDYDAELRLYNEHFRVAAAVRRQDRVLDVGCGTGRTTRDAARAAVTGSVLGVDISERMLEHARRVSDDERLVNVTYLRADAGVHHFPPASFDLCISRFGTMFFTDPVAAITNIRRALHPGGRLVLLVWQDRDRNEWAHVIHHALTGTTTPTSPATDPSAFSLGDQATTKRILATVGFTDVSLTAIQEPIYYGPDTDTAYSNVLRLQEPRALLAALGPAAAEQARNRLRATLAAHDTGTGVSFDSSAWIVTASAPQPALRSHL